MLDRTLTRHHAQSGRRRWRNVALFGSIGLLLFLTFYLLLPKPGPRVRDVAISEDELKSLVTRFRAKPPSSSAERKQRAALGRRLFFDAGLSRNGQVSCSTCHDPTREFTDGKAQAQGLRPLSKNSPTIVNTYLNSWFFWDGRADSLAAQALKPIEDPREHGISRLRVVKRLKDRYLQEYEEAFGSFPANLMGPLPEDGLPPPSPLKLHIDTAAYALATLGSFSLLDDVLKTAQASRLAPAVELSRRAFAGAPGGEIPKSWYDAYQGLAPADKHDVDQVFANFGRAIADFETGFAATQSPFDAFAKRVDEGKTAQEALGDGFGQTELMGLKLFAGPGRCTLCHDGPNFTDQQFHNEGLEQVDAVLDVGRATGVQRALADPFNCAGPYLPQAPEVQAESCRELPFLATENFELVGAFKTPSLRNVARTAPYMHDGRFATLSDVLEHYNELEDRPATGHREETLKALGFTKEELQAVEAFLVSLSSPVRDYNGLESASTKP